ncbi:MAG TPA: heavy metal translocating P-type ATPase metal-binding domain-containing protein, partial [Bacteroidota bacterium]|nr:heavy metal translocating P-type ATPase metal-binding domain-containing protein [Bacteroidota bacterium]
MSNVLENTSLAEATERCCDHCGDRVLNNDCADSAGKLFCCNGCKVVYELLHENDLCDYYSISERPGRTPRSSGRFDYLDDEQIQQQLHDFRSETISAATLSIPAIHCSSCIWLLEHLHRLDAGIIHARTDFLKKRLTVQYQPGETTLRRIVELLASLGYAPEITLEKNAAHRAERTVSERSLYYKVGIAGFCFANIMLLSFPEYLSVGTVEAELRRVFGLVNLILALPVVFYCASGYFLSAARGLRKRTITLDVPIALGIAVVFARSLAEIVTHSGAGFLDSLAGLVFFLLLGKLFQNKTYDRLNFERNYASYFPIAITVIKNGIESSVPLDRLLPGDKILVRNGEIIPADAYVLGGHAAIDYSFVTGESTIVERKIGDLVYAGGRQSGSIIELQIAKEVSQSYLTQLWNADAYTEKKISRMTAISDAVGKYFTVAVLAIAALTGIWWAVADPARALNAVTGILIIACPCALALSTPFALGTAMRIMGRNKCYIKNTSIIESLAAVDTLVFDKTGTLTQSDDGTVRFVGPEPDDTLRLQIRSLAAQSTHPMSRMICRMLGDIAQADVLSYNETAGEGISGCVCAHSIRIGSRAFAGGNDGADHAHTESRAYVSVDGAIKGYFVVGARYRKGIGPMLESLSVDYSLTMLSGDNDSERTALRSLFSGTADLHFFQSPMDKLRRVQSLQADGRRTA